jgi:SAM-dependent methyltransferase
MTYSKDFFANAAEGSRKGAEAILELVAAWIDPRSAIDVGCGTGIWLRVLKDRGVRVRGVDGSYVDAAGLQIPQESFLAHDLEKPLPALEGADLVISMETAEHLSGARAASFVSDLCRLAPVVLFSAAIPEQGGTAHINEQWPEYWVAKFEDCGFQCIDCVRPAVWHDNGVPYWYVQNTFLAVRRDMLDRNTNLKELASRCPKPTALVHPRHFLEKVESLRRVSDLNNWSLGQILGSLPRLLGRYCAKRRKGTSSRD